MTPPVLRVPAGPQLPQSVIDRARITKARKRFGFLGPYSLAELRREYLAQLYAPWSSWPSQGRHDHELQVLNTYLVLKAALFGTPIPASRTSKRYVRRPSGRKLEPIVIGHAARNACLGPWWWRW